MNKISIMKHMMEMRYIVYKDAMIKAVKSAHQELVDYKQALIENIRQTR